MMASRVVVERTSHKGNARPLRRVPRPQSHACRTFRRRACAAATPSPPPPPSSSRAGVGELGLVDALLRAVATRQAAAVGELTHGLSAGLATLQRVIQPRPAAFPPGPEGDSALDLVQDPVKFAQAVSKQYGGVVGMQLAGNRVVLVTDPLVAKDVMIDRPQLFQKEGTAFFPNSSLAGNGLLVSDGATWRRQRRLSNPAFRTAAVASYAAAMTSATEKLLTERWRAGGIRDVYTDFNDLSLTIVTEALFGTGIEDEAKQREVREAIAEAFDFFGRRAGGGMAVPEWVPTPENVRFLAAVRRLDQLVYALIARRREHHAAQGVGGAASEGAVERDGLLDWLLAARDDSDGGDGGGMTDTALRDEMNTLIIAGAETTAISLSFTCALLAQHPAVAARVAHEASTVLGARRRPTAADYAALPYTQAVVLEVLRVLPPAYMVGRCCVEDLALDGYQVEAGTTVLISPFVIHRDAAYWREPERFDPARFLDEGGGVVAGTLAGMGTNGAYVPFGAGPRGCIGTMFAMMETVLVTAMIARDFEVSLPAGAAPPATRPLITLRPAGSVELLLRRRRATSSASTTAAAAASTGSGVGDEQEAGQQEAVKEVVAAAPKAAAGGGRSARARNASLRAARR